MMNIEQRLLNPSAYPHYVDKVEHVETHISHIFLAGEYAYKVKKPLNLGFLDFSTLEARKHFCTEEVRLNSRLAKGIYIDVVSIICSDDRVFIANNKTDKQQIGVVEYAVRMHRFDREMELNQLLEHNSKLWKDEWLDELAIHVAKFHSALAYAKISSGYGEADMIFSYALENFAQIKQHLQNQEIIKVSEQLRVWTLSQQKRLSNTIKSRLRDGFVRECHGDMHLANMVHWQDKVQIFDGIEFSAELRWIDVISEIAFLIMDLESRGRADLGWRFLNGYLAASGDYQGLKLLDFYCSYRASVRAKVISIRCSQLDDKKEQKILLDDVSHYLTLASSYTQARKPNVIMLHGLSGSGKSTIAASLSQLLPAIWIRSDVERKRLFGLFDDTQESSLKGDMYASEANSATYQRLLNLTKMLTSYGYCVIVDATFLKAKQRQMFYQAFTKKCPLVVIDLHADKNTLRQRVYQRAKENDNISDAGVAVLEKQLYSIEPVDKVEGASILTLDTNRSINPKQLVNKVRRVINTMDKAD